MGINTTKASLRRADSNLSKVYRKRLRQQARWNPWKDGFELEWAGRSLLQTADADLFDYEEGGCDHSQSIRRIQRRADVTSALRLVGGWKVRANDRLPHSIETTYALAQCLWNDHCAHNNETHNNKTHKHTHTHIGDVDDYEYEYERNRRPIRATFGSSRFSLRLAYATALVRGVNGLADSIQQFRGTAASIASLCDRLGLPGWLVDVRHEAAHNDLPSLDVLRLASQTLLGFLQNRFWGPIHHVRWIQPHDDAVKILVQYTASADSHPSTSRVRKTVGALKKGEEDLPPQGDDHPIDEENDEEDHIDGDESNGKYREEEDENIHRNQKGGAMDDLGLMWQRNIGTSTNRYAALFEEDRSKPRKKRRTTASTDASDQSRTFGDNSKREATAGSRGGVKSRAQSPAALAIQLTKTIPLHVGYHTVVSYLVWGGVGDAPLGWGVLIPGPPSSFPISHESVEHVRQRFRPLLVKLLQAWPGIVATLLIHLVDCILLIENRATTMALQRQISNDDHGDDGDGDGDADQNVAATRKEDVTEEATDAGSHRKLFFLSSWVRFLLSRDFHRHHDKSVAVMTEPSSTTGSNTTEDPNAMKTTRSSRGEEEGGPEFLESPAPCATLRSLELPLNALCDRCSHNNNNNNNGGDDKRSMAEPVRCNSSKSTASTQTTSEGLGRFLEAILGDERISNFGLSPESAAPDIPGGGSIIVTGDDPDDPGSNDLSNDAGSRPLTLAEMEAILAESDDEVVDNDDDNDPMDAAHIVEQPDVGATSDDHSEGPSAPAKHEGETQTPTMPSKMKGSPWTLCEAWEPCAIGSLPGYPV